MRVTKAVPLRHYGYASEEYRYRPEAQNKWDPDDSGSSNFQSVESCGVHTIVANA